MSNFNTILEDLTKNYCELTEDKTVSYVRSMSVYGKEMVEKWNKEFLEYYIYIIDGDNWGDQPIWKDRYKNMKGIDSETVFKLHNLITYEDSMIMYSDEFIIFSEKDLDEKIKELNSKLKYTVSAIKIKTNHFNIEKDFKTTFASYFSILKNLKNEYGRNTIFEMEEI